MIKSRVNVIDQITKNGSIIVASPRAIRKQSTKIPNKYPTNQKKKIEEEKSFDNYNDMSKSSS